MEDQIFNFNDFLNGSFSTKEEKEEKIKPSESINNDIIREEILIPEPSSTPEPEPIPDTIPEEEMYEPEKTSQKFENHPIEDDGNYYILYKDVSEDFTCDISIEGVSENQADARIIVESKDWILMFPGEIKNHKCHIPIRDLKILNEGEVGKIKLEIIADGNHFTPWEDEFKVKMSKKVQVSVDKKSKTIYRPTNERVKVSVSR